MANKKNNLIWIDLEMSGLDCNKDRILEIATIVTDYQLNILATGPVLIVKQSKQILLNMNTWCKNQHTTSGLVEQVLLSNINELIAEQQTLDFLENYVDQKSSPMCGNSICMDRRFLANYMPNLEKYFNYQNLDVSTMKILAKIWAQEVYHKKSKHRALEDIQESINELKFYRKNNYINSKLSNI